NALTRLISAETEPLVMREKRAYHKVTVLGPQHLRLDDRRRYSGIPAGAADDRDGRLWARLWPKLAWQMTHSQPGAYVRPAQTYKLAGTYAPGWVVQRGAVRPVEMATDPQGANRMLAWPETRWARSGRRLEAVQNAALEGLTGGSDKIRGRADHLRRNPGGTAAGAGRGTPAQTALSEVRRQAHRRVPAMR